MIIEQFEIPGLAQYAYIVSSQGEAIVIDPMRDFDRYTDYASAHDLVIRCATETHIHADFASGAAALAAETGAELALSGYDQDEQFGYAMAHRKLMEGDTLLAGKIRLQVLHTPGHTPEHISFLLFDVDRSQTIPLAIFSGDFLFVGALGRPDLLGDAEKQRLSHELYRSLHQRISRLPDALILYPGHGAGSLCGAGISMRPSSTLGYERATQPLFTLDEDHFTHEILASVPPMPVYYPHMKALNAKGAISFRQVAVGQLLSPDELHSLAASSNVTLLDLRSPEAFGGAHIPCSINIGDSQNLSLWAGWLLDPAKSIVLVNDAASTANAIRSLLRVGLDAILGSLNGGIVSWINAGMDLARTPQISTREVASRASDVLLLDVRTTTEWTSGRISGAEHIMLGDLPHRLASLPQNIPIVTVCGSGYRSSIAASQLQASGFTQVSSMDGGMSAWKQRQLPIEMPRS